MGSLSRLPCYLRPNHYQRSSILSLGHLALEKMTSFSVLMRNRPGLVQPSCFASPWRKTLSPSVVLSHNQKREKYGCVRWTADENARLASLVSQGLSTVDIADKLGCSPNRVRDRRLRNSRLQQPSSTESWTAQEDKILKEKKEAGLATTEIVNFLPGRNLDSIYRRWRIHLHSGASSSSSKSRSRGPYTDANIRHIIDLRTNQHFSLQQIALRLGRSLYSIQSVWHERCRNMVPQEILDAIQRPDEFSPKEDQLLMDLYNQGVKQVAMTPHFPGRSYSAICCHLYRLQLFLPKLRARQDESARLKKAVHQHVDGKLSMDEVYGQFPNFSRDAIRARVKRARKKSSKASIKKPSESGERNAAASLATDSH